MKNEKRGGRRAAGNRMAFLVLSLLPGQLSSNINQRQREDLPPPLLATSSEQPDSKSPYKESPLPNNRPNETGKNKGAAIG
jgi:hypothetical protein